jgi:outer membrane biosynthesis protein TonB
MSAPAFGENNKQKNKKSVAWIGLGAGAILAGVIGIFTLTQSSADSNSNQKNNSVPIQATAVETITNNSSSDTASNKLNAEPQKAKKPIEEPAEKQAEKLKVEKEKIQPKEPTTATKAESAPKKDASKRNQPTKKKVTLDDLIN